MSKNQAYAEKYAEAAMEQMKRYGIPASVILAQGILESSNGQSQLAQNENNHFGIKATASWLNSGGKYALYTRPQDGFIDAGSGGGIGWALVDDITHAEVKEEKIIDQRYYHTIKEVKNGEGPHPIKTPKGWLHLAHGVRGCAAGLRYVLYMYMTSLEDPTKLIATPGGAFMVPEGEERIGDVSNVLFTNGWIADEDGTVFIYYASSDTRMHVATSTIDKLVDYCMNTPADGLSSSASVETLKKLIDKNLQIMK